MVLFGAEDGVFSSANIQHEERCMETTKERLKAVSRTGVTVTLATEHELLSRYGVKRGDRIIHLERNSLGTVLGVGYQYEQESPGKEVLWVQLDADKGDATYVTYIDEIGVIIKK